MTIPGSLPASSGNKALGSPQQLSYQELESTASTEVAKNAMRIVTDTLEIPILQVDQDTRKYQSAANRPVIPMLYTTRTVTSFETPPDLTWQSAYDEMVNMFPQEFRDFFNAAMLISADSRNPNVTILNTVLVDSAKMLATLRAASQPLTADSIQAERALDNITLPYVSFNTLALVNEFIVTEGLKYLELVGPNDPNFDRIAGALGDLALIVQDLKTASTLITSNDTLDEGKVLLASIYDQITALSSQYDSISGTGDFLLIGNMLHAAQLFTAGLLLDHPGATAMLLGLVNANYDIDNPDSKINLVGSTYSAINQAISDNLPSLFLNGATEGEKLFGSKLIETSLLTALLWGALNYDGKVTNNSKTDPSPSEIAEQNLAHELRLNFLINSGLLSSVGNVISQEAGADPANQKSMSSLIEASLLLYLIAPSLKGHDLSASRSILQGIGDQLAASISSGGIENKDLSPSLKVYFQQAAIALENNDVDGLLNIFDNAIQLSGTSSSQFVNDIQELKDTAHDVTKSVDQSRNLAATTGIIHAA